MKMITLLAAAVIDGAVRYPIEGPLSVPDDVADSLVEGKQAELADVDGNEADDGDGLDRRTVEQLKATAEAETIDLGEATRRAEIIAAIRKARAAAASAS